MAFLSFNCPGCKHEIAVRWPGSPSPELPLTIECEDCGWNGTVYARDSNEHSFPEERAS